MDAPQYTGPRWTWQDSLGVERSGHMEKCVDKGGTDVTYFMVRDDGTLDVLSGSRIRTMRRAPAMMVYYDLCGCCGHYHRPEFAGDCRDDAERFTAAELDAKHGPQGEGWEETDDPDEPGT